MVEQFGDSQAVKVAMLIDGDNAQPSLIGGIITETAKYGAITIRRVYGDWTTANMAGWKNVLNNYAIQPIQQFRYTVGKNTATLSPGSVSSPATATTPGWRPGSGKRVSLSWGSGKRPPPKPL
jgi:hypothetical protein